MKTARNRECISGFTLIEVLAASIILSLVLAIAASSFTNIVANSASVERSYVRSLAMLFARELIQEQLRLNPNTPRGTGQWGGEVFSWSELDVKQGRRFTDVEFTIGPIFKLRNIEVRWANETTSTLVLLTYE